MSPLRIWHQTTLNLDDHPNYRRFVLGHQDAVFADSSTSVELFGMPFPVETQTAGRGDRSPYSYLTGTGRFLVSQAERAQAAGYAAFVIGSYAEPLLREIRSAVSIPVTSALESTVLMACSTARRIGMITSDNWNIWNQQAALSKHKLTHRIAGYWVARDLDGVDLDTLFDEPSTYLADFRRAGFDAIAGQADTIIPSSEVVAAVVASAGIKELDGVSVMDGVAVPLLHAEMMAKAHRTIGLEAGRHWHYPLPAPEFASLRKYG